MPYTLLKYLGWLLPALLIGLGLGYWLWGRRTTVHTVDVDSETQRLRHRVANLEATVHERDRLAAELADCRAATKTAPVVSVAAPAFAGVAPADHETVVAERDRLQGVIGEHEHTIGELRSRVETAEAESTQLRALAAMPDAPAEPSTPDVAGAEAVLGRKIKLDDLKVVEGVGPKIEELIHALGTTTWWGLANTEPAALRAMLDAAGPRFQMHDPGTWPEQAGLLARGQWADFKELTDRLDGGKAD